MALDSNKTGLNKMDNNARISVEYILLIGFIFVPTIYLASSMGDSNELDMAMSSARSGATQGANIDSLAVYPADAFSDYQKDNPRLLIPSEVQILRIEYKNMGYNASYNRIKIQLRVYASAPSVKYLSDRNSLGDRINFNVRKSITESFKTENLTNTYYNPAFSTKYVFTTGEVSWI